jgi:hypothetical protein
MHDIFFAFIIYNELAPDGGTKPLRQAMRASLLAIFGLLAAKAPANTIAQGTRLLDVHVAHVPSL